MGTISQQKYVFQCDSEIVRKTYEEQDNFRIEYSNDGEADTCAIYFSSNDIYFPNNEEVFRKRIVERDAYEWFGTRISRAKKHIFVRDVQKQWFLAGISSRIPSPEDLVNLLRQETKEYAHVITLGSSAGGYAAMLYGSLIGAEQAIAFNPQFEIVSLLRNSSENINPLVFRLKSIRDKWYDVTSVIEGSTEIFCFYSNRSRWDIEQHRYAPVLHNLHYIAFKSSHHGIPFLKVALVKVINMTREQLLQIASKNNRPLLFTIKMVGLRKTICGLWEQVYDRYKRRR